jgi:hypothetical protein
MQRRSSMPENMKISSLTQEMIRRLLNTSEDLDDRERLEVINGYTQKLINSGYGLEQTRNIIVAGLKGYERKLKLSRDLTNPRWKPLHVPTSFNATARRHQKLLAKGNWFKKRKSSEDEEDQPEQSSSPAERRCLSVSRNGENSRVSSQQCQEDAQPGQGQGQQEVQDGQERGQHSSQDDHHHDGPQVSQESHQEEIPHPSVSAANTKAKVANPKTTNMSRASLITIKTM